MKTIDNIYPDPNAPSPIEGLPDNIYGPPAPAKLPDKVADTEARKADYALRGDSPGFDSLFGSFSSGYEKDVRVEAAAKEDQKHESYRTDFLRRIEAKSPKDLTPLEIDYIMGATARSKQDPNFVLEAKFADNWINDIVQGKHTDVYKNAAGKATQDFMKVMDSSKELVAKTQAVQHLKSRLQANYDEMPWLSVSKQDKLTDMFLNAMPFYGWHDIVNNFKGMPSSVLWPGKNIEDQVKYFWGAPANKTQELLDQVQALYEKNPSQGIALSNAILTYSRNDAMIDNALAGLDIATSLPIGTAIKLSAKAGKVAEKTASVAKQAATIPSAASTEVTSALKTEIGTKAAADTVTVDQRLSQAVHAEWVARGERHTAFPIQSIRQRLPDIPREELDAALKRTLKGEDSPFILYRQDNLAARTEEEAAGAIQVGGEPRELIFVDPAKVNKLKEVSEVRTALKDAVKAQASPNLDPQFTMAAVGDIENAAIAGSAKEVAARQAENAIGATPKEIQPLVLNAHHLMQPGKFFEAGLAASNEAANRLTASALKLQSGLLSTLEDATKITRLGEPAMQEAVGRSAKFYQEGFGKVAEDSINNIAVIPPDKTMTNAGLLEFWFGKGDATFFPNEETGRNYLKQIVGLKDEFEMRQQGGGWYGVVTKPVRETWDSVRNTMISTDATKTPKTWAGFLLSKFKTVDDLTSYLNTVNRKVATMAPSEMKYHLTSAMEDINKIGNKGRDELRKVLEHDRVQLNPLNVNNGPGMYRDTRTDFEKIFKDLNGKLPTEDQVQAYQRIVAIDNYDGILRNLQWVRDLHRQGVEQFKVKIPGKGSSSGAVTDSQWMSGRRIPDIDWSSKSDALILGIDNTTGAQLAVHRFDDTREVDAFKAVFKEKIASGEVQVIEIANPKARPLKDMVDVDAPINYVIINSAEYKPLQLGDVVPWTPGGHLRYNDDHFLKQIKVSQGYKGNMYNYGDKTIIAIKSEREGKALEKVWNEAQKILLTGDDAALSAYLNKHLPWDLNEFKKMYTGAGPGGGLDANIPVVLTQSGKEVLDMRPDLRNMWPKLKDTTSTDLFTALDKTFIGERGSVLNTAAMEGSEANPLFRIDAPNLLNPYATVNRAMGNAIRGRWMGDYKIHAAEHWVEEFKDVLNVSPEQLRSNPIYWMYKAEGQFNENADRATLKAAKEARIRTLSFIGYQSELGRDISHIESKIVNLLGGKQDPSTWGGYLTTGMLDTIKDPATHMRAAAFHMKLGFFSPSTFLTQIQTWNHILAISPGHVGEATAAAWLNRVMLRTEDEAVLKRYAKVARVFGWKEDDFLEAFKTMKETGWHNVGSESAWRNDAIDVKIFKSTWGNILDKGTIFFTEGERATRMAAWNAAYREWRAANPGIPVTDAIKGKILNRADTMTGNMTRASNAAWNEGALSVPTQFLSYSARMAEQLLGGLKGGGRISRTEAARAIGVYSTLYGVPVGVGAAVGFYPMYEDVKAAAMNLGININDKWFKLATDGLMAYTLGLATGQDFNVAQRLGPGGSDNIRKIFAGDKKWYEVLLGASGSTFANMLSNAYPFTTALWKSTSGDTSGFPLVMDNYIDAAKEISSINNAYKFYAAMNTHKVFAKNQRYIGDVSTLDSVFMGLTGLTPRSITDGYIAVKNEKDIREGKIEAEQRIQAAYRRAITAYSNNDDKLGDKLMGQAGAMLDMGDFTFTERSAVFKKSMNNNESLIDQVERRRQIRQMTTPKAGQ